MNSTEKIKILFLAACIEQDPTVSMSSFTRVIEMEVKSGETSHFTYLSHVQLFLFAMQQNNVNKAQSIMSQLDTCSQQDGYKTMLHSFCKGYLLFSIGEIQSQK